jgi:hypothetical protein
MSVGSFLIWPLNVVTLGLLGRLLRVKFERAGDATVWPFMRRTDYEQASKDSASVRT